MLSRRRFVQASSLALTGTACNVAKGNESPTSDLPPSIAALTSMKDQATPISVDERRGRIEKARRLMTEQKIDALMLTGGTSMVYFTGMQWGLSERMTAVIIPAKGDAFIVTPKFEEERTLEQARTGPLGAGTQVMTWEEHESPSERVAQGLRAAGVASGSLGVEETVRFVFSNMVATAAPSIRITSGTPVTAGCRTVKDTHELALMRLASQVTLKAYEAAWKALADGMTQNDFADLVAKAHRQLGFDGSAGVQVGEFSALPHGSVKPQVIREGTILLIDGGCKVEGYSSDLSRTFVLGKATDRMKSVFEIEHRAQSAALAAAKPGVECQAVDAAARKVIEDGGFGPGYKFFTHRVGHGMGMDGHEWPYLVKGNTLPLQPGMTFSDEPGIYIPGEFGCRLEDDMVITETGAELFTPQSQSLEQPF
ncbi:MAG TPA: Xaa-Pro peptidase family protein [Gemmatimonadaceae bacterium]|jgi:Xaa-Pro dipeptidase|nr:Xaa-Pro peptidase family protein [Gemmatimonadaceae bacterium]